MTKRACPFDSTIYRQLKVHVSDYDNDINAIKEIHEKTIKKLLSGSKYLLPNTCSIQAIHTEHKIEPLWDKVEPCGSGCSKTKSIKQQQVTSYFTCGKKQNQESIIVPKEIVETKLVCSYCDGKTDSVHQCIKCQESFCQSCSFVCYGPSEDVWTCLSCS